MPGKQLLFLPIGNQILTTDLLAKTNTHVLNPTELHCHGCTGCKEGWSELAEMEKPDVQEQSQTEIQMYNNQVPRVKKGANRSVKGWQKGSIWSLGTSQAFDHSDTIHSLSFSQTLSQHTQDADSIREC